MITCPTPKTRPSINMHSLHPRIPIRNPRTDVHMIQRLGVLHKQVGVALILGDVRDLVDVAEAGEAHEVGLGLCELELVPVAGGDDAGARIEGEEGAGEVLKGVSMLML